MDTNEFVTSHEAVIRLGFFTGILGIMALWERLVPRRAPSVSRLWRWVSNLGLVFVNTLVLRLLFPTALVGVAIFAEDQRWGLLHNWPLPFWLAVGASVMALDLTIYLQHVLMHALPVLWRLHRVHHADLDFDVTTGLRFHPLEAIVSMLIKFGAVALLGPPVAAVVAFEVLLNATSQFNHSNVRLAAGIDRLLRLFLVTPDMHRVHHSVEEDETNSNFGFNLPWWDRLFGTYRAQPRASHDTMTIGIRTFRDPKHCIPLPALLAMPFHRKPTDYTINRRFLGKP